MKSVSRRLLLWALFVCLAALSVYGFYSEKLFSQAIWEPAGPQRFGVFAAAFLFWFAAVYAFRPALAFPLTILAALVYSILSVGAAPILSIALFLSSSVALGRWLLPANPQLKTGPDRVIDVCLAALIASSVFMWAVGLGAHFPVNYPAVYGVMLTLPLVLRFRFAVRGIRECVESMRAATAPRGTEAFGLAAVLFIGFAHLLVTLKPEVSTDGLAMHLALPFWVANHHSWPFDLGHLAWAVMPMGADWCFTAVFLLGGEYAARLLNVAMLLVIAALLWAAVRRWAGNGISLLIAALFLASPLVQLVTGSLFVENIWAALLFGAILALWRFREFGTARYLLVAAVLLGAGMATKFGSVGFVAPFCFMAAYELVRRSRHGGKRMLALAIAAGLLFAIFAVPPYLTAYLKTGNPIFPFANGLFKSPNFDTETTFIDSRFRTPLTPAVLYDMTFRTSKHLESQNGGWGFQYFLFLPLIPFVIRRDWPYLGRLALAVSVPFAIVTLTAQNYVRYLYPALPLWMLLIALLIAGVRDIDRRLHIASVAAAVITLCLNLCFLPASNWYHKGFALNPFNASDRSAYIERSAPMRKVIDYLNQKHPGAPASILETNHIAGLRGKAFTTSWHNYTFSTDLRRTRNALNFLALATGHDLRVFVASANARATNRVIDSFLIAYTDTEVTSGPYIIARLKPEFAGAAGLERARSLEMGNLPSPSGTYDDASPRIHYSGPWEPGTDFPKAFECTVAYSDAREAEARFAFTGMGLTYVYTKAPNRGIASISIDGQPAGRLDLYSRDIVWRAQTTFEGLEPGDHTVAIRVLREKQAAATGFFVDLDALIVK